MDGFPANDPQEGLFLPVDPDPLPREEQFIHAADGGEIEISLIINVFHHEADFIAVAGEHDDGPCFSFNHTVGISEDIGLDLVHEILNSVPKNLLYRLLVTGRAWRFG
jgi:hypothetical protein